LELVPDPLQLSGACVDDAIPERRNDGQVDDPERDRDHQQQGEAELPADAPKKPAHGLKR
jgi:hypothetical protein